MPPLKSGRSAIGLLKALVAACLIGPMLLLSVAAWVNWRVVVSDAERELAHASEVGRAQAARVFDAQSQVADRINDLIVGMDEPEIRASELRLHGALASIAARLPQVQSVLLVDRTGHALVSAVAYPVPRDVDLSRRDYFRAVIDGYHGTYISAVQMGDINRQQFFGLSRPWVGPDGETRGVIDVAVSPQSFVEFYKAAIGDRDGSSSGVLTLLRNDGQILVRYPAVAGELPHLSDSSPFFAAIAANPARGTYEDRSIIDSDAPARLYAYQKIEGYPAYIVAARDRRAIVADWRYMMAGQLVFGIPCTLALFGLTWTALARTRREEAALARERREIERRREAEAALLRAQRLEAVGQLTGGVAHDFNNLLTVILGSAEMLARRPEDTKRVRRLAGQIALAARRGGEITHHLLAFSRRQVLQPENIDLNLRLREFKPLLDRAARKLAQVKFDLASDLGTVLLDPGHFESAILNLVGNARDAMPEGGCIGIMTRNVALAGSEYPELLPGPYVCVSVTDTGSGMNPDTVARAFEPFFTTKDIGKGTGLGLSQVYGFAKQAGGEARIVSIPGQGTTVSLLLPRSAEGMAAGALPAIPTTCPEPGEVVLVVEDDPEVLATALEMLHDFGYATLAAMTGRAALDHLRTGERVDLLFSDVLMPGSMNGPQLAAEAVRLRPGLKVLLTSGYLAESHAGAPAPFPMLAKPYDRETLAARVQLVLGGRSGAADPASGHLLQGWARIH